MVYILLLLLLTSCASYFYQDAAADMFKGRFEKAEEKLAGADEPYQKCNDATLLLLSRAMVYFQSGKTKESLADFQKSLDALDYYKKTVAHEAVGQLLLQDSVAAYVPPAFEEGLARFYQSLAFLHDHDEANASASVHYLETHQHSNPLTTYLLATLFQRRGDVSNARILASRLNLDIPQGNTLLIHHRGKVPAKKSEKAPWSSIDAALLEKILAEYDVEPAYSTLVGIPIPVLEEPTYFSTRFLIDRHHVRPKVQYSVAQVAKKTLEEEDQAIATVTAAARILLRRAAVASTKKEYQPLMDITMGISNLATHADTRSWTTLPCSIDLYHLDLTPGAHTLHLNGKEFTVTILPNQLNLIDIFQPTEKKINVLTQDTP